MYRIIIADDEAIECRALEMMIRNSYPRLEILPSVYNGADLIASVEQYQPDIAIVDINMPRMNGLDALDVIKARNTRMKVIISTAYSEFDYVQRALKLGVCDYILKPVEKGPFLDTLGRTLRTLDGEQQKVREEDDTQKQIGEMNSVVGSEFLSSLLLGEPDENSFRLYLRSLDCTWQGGCLMMVRDLKSMDSPEGKERCGRLSKWMQKEMAKFCRCVGKRHKRELYFLILSESQMKEETAKEWLTDMAGILRPAAAKQGWDSLVFGISTWKTAYEDMDAGLAECRLAARSQAAPGIYFYQDIRKQRHENPLASVRGSCLDQLRAGNAKRCIQELKPLIGTMEQDGTEPKDLQLQILEFILPLMDAMEEGQDLLERYSQKGKIDFAALKSCTDRASLEQWLESALKKLAAKSMVKERKSRDYIERTIIYMETHYQEDISLEQASEASGISSFYLSRLLKQELNQTFVEILTDIRMRQALKLLWDGRYTVKEIAEQTGYSSITYFYKVFKKYTGRNIGEMREYLQNMA